METVIEASDKLVILAGDDSAIRLSEQALPGRRGRDRDTRSAGRPRPEHTLVLGWNGRAARIIEQLDKYVTDGSDVDIVTDRDDADGAVSKLTYGLQHLVADASRTATSATRAVLESLDVASVRQRDRALRRPHGPADRRRPRAGDAAAPARHPGEAGRGRRDRQRDARRPRPRAGPADPRRRLRDQRAAGQPADDADLGERAPRTRSSRTCSTRTARRSTSARPTTTCATRRTSRSRPLAAAARRRGEVAIGYRIADSGEGHGIVLNPDKTAIMPPIDRLIVLARG